MKLQNFLMQCDRKYYASGFSMQLFLAEFKQLRREGVFEQTIVDLLASIPMSDENMCPTVGPESLVIAKSEHHEIRFEVFADYKAPPVLQGLSRSCVISSLGALPLSLCVYQEQPNNYRALSGPSCRKFNGIILLEQGIDVVALAPNNAFPFGIVRFLGPTTENLIRQYNPLSLAFQGLAAPDSLIARKIRLLRVVQELRLTDCMDHVRALSVDDCPTVSTFATDVFKNLSEMQGAV